MLSRALTAALPLGALISGLVAGGCGTTGPGEEALRVAPASAVAHEGPAAGAGAADGAAVRPGAPPGPRAPVLAPAPRLDLDANRARWHVADRGLVIPLGDEGLRKYDLAYRSPWRDAVTVDGRRARAARGKATLTFPWLDDDGPATVVVRGRGPARIALALDGRKLGEATLGAGWGSGEVAVPAGALTPGEHELTVDARGALLGGLELVPAARAELPPCDDGWRRVSLHAELPAAAHLVARPVATGPVRIALTPEDGPTQELYAGPAAGLPPALALPEVGERVVRLDLEAPGCARWDGVQLAVPADAPAARPAARPAPVDNVVLVVIDTLRADRLRAYGETRVETPWLTAAAARGAVFLRNQAMAPSSPPSHGTIHSGQIPRVHGIIGDEGELGPDTPLLSVIARAAGLATLYVGNNDFAMGRWRARGQWEVFETPYYRHGKDCGPMFARGLELARAAAAERRRFFLTLLPIEPHVAYRFHEGITEKYFAGPWAAPFGKKVTSAHLGRIKKMRMTDALWAQVRALYDGEVERVDRCLAALEDGLRDAGVLERTSIVIASDHGEGLGERGANVGHAYGLYRELVDTPLVVIGGVPAARVSTPTSNADLAPTVLELLGLPADRRMQGRSLVADALAPPLPRVAASEYGRSYALRAARWHLVVGYDGRAELFDTAADPDELDDRSGRRRGGAPAAAIPLRYLRDAAGLYLAHRAAWRASSWGALNDLAPGNPLAADALTSAR